MLGGIVMSGVVDGREGVRKLWRRIIVPRMIPSRWWIAINLFPCCHGHRGRSRGYAGLDESTN